MPLDCITCGKNGSGCSGCPNKQTDDLPCPAYEPRHICGTCLHVHRPPEDYQGSPDDLYCPRLREEVGATNGCEDWEEDE